MLKFEHIRNKAIELRNRGISLDDISKQLNQSRTTVYYWIKDIEVKITRKANCVVASKVLHEKYKILRDDAYKEGIALYEKYKNDKIFRDFIVIFLTEGTRKNRNGISVVNTNPKMLLVVKTMVKKFSKRKINYRLYVYPDTNLEEAIPYWRNGLGLDDNEIVKVHTKTQQGNLRGRNNVIPYGTLTISSNDTYFRSKMQAWVDILQQDWENLK